MAVITNLVIYDSVLFNRTGHIRRWADRVERQFTLNAIERAPVNKRVRKSPRDAVYPPGSLKASIRGDVDKVAPRIIQTLISVNVPYAEYVIGGTSVITPNTSPYLKLPRNPGRGTRTRFNVVPGQRANDFLSAAGAATARTHPSLRGFEDQIFKQF